MQEIEITASEEEIWYRGSISYFDFSAFESDGNFLYRIVIPKGTPVQIYLARTYTENPDFFITEDEVLEAESPEELIVSLNSIGYDVVEIPSDLYDISPIDAKIHWLDKRGNNKILGRWEAKKMHKDGYDGTFVTSKAITYGERKRQEPEIKGILQQIANNKNKGLN